MLLNISLNLPVLPNVVWVMINTGSVVRLSKLCHMLSGISYFDLDTYMLHIVSSLFLILYGLNSFPLRLLRFIISFRSLINAAKTIAFVRFSINFSSVLMVFSSSSFTMFLRVFL